MQKPYSYFNSVLDYLRVCLRDSNSIGHSVLHAFGIHFIEPITYAAICKGTCALTTTSVYMYT